MPQAMIEMKNKETPFCESAQRTEPYAAGEQKGVDDVIRPFSYPASGDD